MIEFVQGELVAKRPESVTVRVGGMGFNVRIPLTTYEALPRPGEEARLLTHLHVREDELALYGFATGMEREMFLMLIGVSHVGPMVALRVVSACPPAQFKRYILDEDADTLRALVKGIGKKTAARLILELKEVVERLAVQAAESAGADAARDAVDALVALGESRAAAQKAVNTALQKLGSGADQQALVQEALSR